MLKKLLIATLALTTITAFAESKVKSAVNIAKNKIQKINPATTLVEIDPATSKLVYLAKKVTGQHSGEVKISKGHLNFDKDALTDGDFEIDMTSISNADISDKDYHKKFIDHMISDDFFAVGKFKTAKFVITNAKKIKDDMYTITGDLTIKGKTAPVTFDAMATKEKATAKVVFDRTKYDIKYGSGKFFQGLGDKMINDAVELDVLLTAKK